MLNRAVVHLLEVKFLFWRFSDIRWRSWTYQGANHDILWLTVPENSYLHADRLREKWCKYSDIDPSISSSRTNAINMPVKINNTEIGSDMRKRWIKETTHWCNKRPQKQQILRHKYFIPQNQTACCNNCIGTEAKELLIPEQLHHPIWKSRLWKATGKGDKETRDRRATK